MMSILAALRRPLYGTWPVHLLLPFTLLPSLFAVPKFRFRSQVRAAVGTNLQQNTRPKERLQTTCSTSQAAAAFSCTCRAAPPRHAAIADLIVTLD